MCAFTYLSMCMQACIHAEARCLHGLSSLIALHFISLLTFQICASVCLCVSTQGHGTHGEVRGRFWVLVFSPSTLRWAVSPLLLCVPVSFQQFFSLCLPAPYSGTQDHRGVYRCIWLLCERPDAGSQSSVPSTFLVSPVSIPPQFLRQDLLLNPQFTDWATRAGPRDPFTDVCYHAFSMGAGNLNPALFAFRTNTLLSLQSPPNYYFLVCNTVFHIT